MVQVPEKRRLRKTVRGNGELRAAGKPVAQCVPPYNTDNRGVALNLQKHFDGWTCGRLPQLFRLEERNTRRHTKEACRTRQTSFFNIQHMVPALRGRLSGSSCGAKGAAGDGPGTAQLRSFLSTWDGTRDACGFAAVPYSSSFSSASLSHFSMALSCAALTSSRRPHASWSTS